MSSYSLYIDTETFRGDSNVEIARILRSHANFITREGDRHGRHPLRDRKGQTIGQARCGCTVCNPTGGRRFFSQAESQGIFSPEENQFNSGYGSDANGGR